MDLRTAFRSPAVLVVAALVIAAGLAFSLAVAWGSQPDAVPAAAPSPSPTPSPSPSPTPPPPPPPVAGTLDLDVIDLSITGTDLYRSGQSQEAPVPLDDAAITALADGVRDLLDAHLTDLQAGGDGALSTRGLAGDAAAPRGLVAPDRVVEEAHYAVTVAALGAPEWASVRVTVTDDAGGRAQAAMAFWPGQPPQLVMYAPGDGS